MSKVTYPEPPASDEWGLKKALPKKEAPKKEATLL